MLSESLQQREVLRTDAGLGHYAPSRVPPRACAWMSWRGALLLIAVSLAARLVYLIWLCPYQLLGDEAYYWEQARHFDLCYNEKGPVLAWMIASTGPFSL